MNKGVTIITLLTMLLASGTTSIDGKVMELKQIMKEREPETVMSETVTEEPEPEVVAIETTELSSETTISEADIELIALVTMAEAEGECEEGKRLVIDTILNRVDSEYFPNTVYGVVYQQNQFTSMWNGRADRCYVKEDICQLVREELECRTNSEVIFFRTSRYSDYGVPMFQVGSHYFSSYN